MKSVLCIAGKGEVACRALSYAIEEMKMCKENIVVVPTRSDVGVPSWQPSLRLLAQTYHISIASLEDVQKEEKAVFVSLEFDRIIKTKDFKSNRLYNIHFSKLPAYRGVGMAAWPILNGDVASGVTLHCIDDGIDTGDIIDQREFVVKEEWDCRDLYMKFNAESFQLFKKWIPVLLSDDKIPTTPQSVVGATYYSKRDVNYDGRDYGSCFLKTAWQASAALRSATFWEYQLPRVDGRRVMRSQILSSRSTQRPGHIANVSKYRSVLSTVDYDVAVTYCAYDDLYDWASRRCDSVSEEAWTVIDDIDKLDKNGWSALMMAAYNVNLTCLSECIRRGANVNRSNYKGTTPLMFAKDGAIINGDMSCLKALLDHGADVNATDYKGLTIFDYLNKDCRENADAVKTEIARYV